MPALVERAIEADGPAGAAFFEGEFQRREAAGDAAEKQRLADTVGRGGEMADLVVHEVGDRVRMPQLRPNEWKVGVSFSSTHLAQTGS